MYDEYSKSRGDSPAVITGKPVGLGGSLGRDAATGRGALFALDRIAHSRRWTREHIRIAVEGFGNAGAWFAQLAHQMGYRVVAASDSRGAVLNPEGPVPTTCWSTSSRRGAWSASSTRTRSRATT